MADVANDVVLQDLVPAQTEKELEDLPVEDKQSETLTAASRGTLEITDAGLPISPPQYRQYKRRFVGALGVFMLNFLGGYNVVWFGPISNNGEYLTVMLFRVFGIDLVLYYYFDSNFAMRCMIQLPNT